MAKTAEDATVPACTALSNLRRSRCRLPTVVAVAGETVSSGRNYVCPARRHLLINADKTFALAEYEPLGRPCPSAAWLFHTVAATSETDSVTAVLAPEQMARVVVCAVAALDLERIHRPFDGPLHTSN